MNYYKQLYQKLRGAGFPIHEFNGEPGDRHACHCGAYEREECTPTLSELIEACGEKFLSLEYVIDGGIDGKEKLWWVISRRSLVPEEYQVAGETPEEAVAGLWLELHKKL